MDILHLVDRLEELFNDSRAIPFTHNVVVDEDRMLELIDQMRIAIPDEVKKSQQLLNQRDRIVAQAQEEAARTIALAREKAEEMMQRDQIVSGARHRAEQILNQARADAEATRRDADDYVMDVLKHIDTDLDRLLTQVRNGLATLQADREREEMMNPSAAPAEEEEPSPPEITEEEPTEQ